MAANATDEGSNSHSISNVQSARVSSGSAAAGPSSAAGLPSPTSPSWKSIFRLGSASSRKPSRSKSALTLNTEFASAPSIHGENENLSMASTHSPAAESHSQSLAPEVVALQEVEGLSLVSAHMPGALTPSSSTSFNTSNGNRYSSTSMGTLSSDYGQNAVHKPPFNGNPDTVIEDSTVQMAPASAASTARVRPGDSGATPGTPDQHFSEQIQTVPVADLLPTPSSSAGQDRVPTKRKSSSKTEKHLKHVPPLTPATEAPSSPGLVSPKSTSRNGMTRLIRRVASAPNAKGLFSLGRNHKDKDAPSGSRTPVRGFGFLSPTSGTISRSGSVPQVPPLPNNAGGHDASEAGNDSLDTDSSGSSQQRPKQQKNQPNGLSSSPTTPSHPHPTLTHSQSVQNLQPSHGGLLSPLRGPRTARANSSASGTFTLRSKSKSKDPPEHIGLLSAPPVPLGPDGQTRAPFRRTYSSNSIKVRSVEVNPSSFQKVKLLGRGDVGKVYLVREKKTEKLYAMKGECFRLTFFEQSMLIDGVRGVL